MSDYDVDMSWVVKPPIAKRQVITKEQWSKLDDKQQEKMLLWCRDHHVIPYDLNLGYLLDFLNEKGFGVMCDQWINDGNGNSLKGKGSWRVGLDWFQGLDKYYFICEKPDLIDALWECCKEVIKS